jgi:membrane associated rhomboid family serine protease
VPSHATIGSSGAASGLAGLFVARFPTRSTVIWLATKQIRLPICIGLVSGLMFQSSIVMLSDGNINRREAALVHLSGFVAGLLTGCLLRVLIRHHSEGQQSAQPF